MGGRNTGQITPALEAKYRSAAIAEADKFLAGNLKERMKADKDPTYRETLINQNIQKILQQNSALPEDDAFLNKVPEGANVRR